MSLNSDSDSHSQSVEPFSIISNAFGPALGIANLAERQSLLESTSKTFSGLEASLAEFPGVGLLFDITQNDGFILQTYWSPDSKRTWLPIPIEGKLMLRNPKSRPLIYLIISRNTISLPIDAWEKRSWSEGFLEADGSSWIRIVLFTPQSC